MPLAALILRGGITPIAAYAVITEPYSLGVAGASTDEPFNFGDLSNAAAYAEEPFNFGANAAAFVSEPFMLGSNAAAAVDEPFDFGTSGGARSGAGSIIPNIGTVTPAPASPLYGWRDR